MTTQEPVRGLPDLVFTANAAVVLDRKVLLARFRCEERQGEEPHNRRFFEALRDRHGPCRLPADSRIVDTGGRKGTAHALSPNGVLKAAWRWLHVPAYLCVNEYGMTEMFSQFYDDALESRASGRLSPRAVIPPGSAIARIGSF